MAKTMKKKTVTKPSSKKAPAKKPSTPKARVTKSAAAPAKAKKAALPDKQDNFMWRLLKKKEAERQKMKDAPQGHLPTQGPGAIGSLSNGFSRFAGPRRRVG
jgi:hypothetical protein